MSDLLKNTGKIQRGNFTKLHFENLTKPDIQSAIQELKTQPSTIVNTMEFTIDLDASF